MPGQRETGSGYIFMSFSTCSEPQKGAGPWQGTSPRVHSNPEGSWVQTVCMGTAGGLCCSLACLPLPRPPHTTCGSGGGNSFHWTEAHRIVLLGCWPLTGSSAPAGKCVSLSSARKEIPSPTWSLLAWDLHQRCCGRPPAFPWHGDQGTAPTLFLGIDSSLVALVGRRGVGKGPRSAPTPGPNPLASDSLSPLAGFFSAGAGFPFRQQYSSKLPSTLLPASCLTEPGGGS